MATFEFYNNNPNGEKEEDCVNRAISLATDADYAFIYYLLQANAYENNCDMLTKMCYRKIIEDRFGLTAKSGYGHTVGEIADKYPNNRVIMRTNGHLTCSVKNSVIKDLFDCRSEIVDEYWVV